jgi:hypothetical protein
MKLKFPTPYSVAWLPRRSATSEAANGLGLAAGSSRWVGRLLPQSEPQRILLKGCIGACFATALTLTGGIAFMASPETLPVIPSAFLGMAVGIVGWISRLSGDLAEYERRTGEINTRTIEKLADTFAQELARLQITTAIARSFHAAGDLEGAPPVSGEVAGSRGDRKERLPATDAPNVLRPQFPNFRRH